MIKIKKIFILLIALIVFSSCLGREKCHLKDVNYDLFKYQKNAVKNLETQFNYFQNKFLNSLDENFYFIFIIDGGLLRQTIYIAISNDNIYFFKNENIASQNPITLKFDKCKKIKLSESIKIQVLELINRLNENKIKNKIIAKDLPIILLKWKENKESEYRENVFYFYDKLDLIFEVVQKCEAIANQQK